jgi:hypothetical protein
VLRWVRGQTVAPFQFRSVKNLKNNLGEMVEYRRNGKRQFEIRIVRGLKLENALEVLLHEASHVNDIAQNGWGKDHSAEHNDNWGKHYSRIYRDYFEAKERGEFNAKRKAK